MGVASVERIHQPVLVGRVVELLSAALRQAERPVFVDATLGLGGHSEALLAACPAACGIGFDRDPQALALARQRLASDSARMAFVAANYDQLRASLDQLGVGRVDAILLDLGLSSLQIDSPERGFAYATDAPLDMRMTPGDGPTAADLLNTWPEADLARIFRLYGDEPRAGRIARAIVARRDAQPFATSAQLVEAVRAATPAPERGGHPAKRVFQALRIAVNDELDSLEKALPQALDGLRPGGRLVVLAYHSGEDRLVKRAFARAAADRVPDGLPQVPDDLRATHRLLTKGAERAGEAETTENPRAASARLRAIEAR
ncbi:MAG: 16S rRNA (cytosine(1402)-N(4))-methyltransferase RsmH [Propionibacteriaceae bacterium]|jgi:16S rRNA (cytosine1402-N4)-methyltransferase|nr:16S rRNA (cytosine(1402)-N(4))-methyltransferase RsmH [Propionibacteriaceae bacterium]